LSFRDQIVDAAQRKAALCIRGGGSKDFYGNAPRGEVLDTRAHAGIVDYEPTELVVTARCGTPLAEIEQVLGERGQCLPFEPPHFGAGATFGGCIAAGLSGPRRASAGALRDFVLGAKLVDGRGRELSFGGQVMKNVAGYDVSRLLAGSLGILGVISEASIKVLPRPAMERTLRLEGGEGAALEMFARWGALPLPVSATLWHDGAVLVRLSGSAAALQAALGRIGGSVVDEAQSAELWRDVREHEHAFFHDDAPLWRLAVPATAAPLGLNGPQLIEWGGGLQPARSATPRRRRAGTPCYFAPRTNPLGRSRRCPRQTCACIAS
jgi:glycolate oxidase FAD binding subunit